MGKGIQATILGIIIAAAIAFTSFLPEQFLLGNYTIYLISLIILLWINVILAFLTLLFFGIHSVTKKNEKKKKIEKKCNSLFKTSILFPFWNIIITISVNVSAHMANWLISQDVGTITAFIFIILVVILAKVATKLGIPLID